MIRVKFIIPDKLSDIHINSGLPDILRQGFSSPGTILVVDKYPQVVHVFGVWNNKYAAFVKKQRRKGLPVVFTSIEGLAPLLNAKGCRTNDITRISAIKRICSSSNIVHVCGNIEKSLLESVSKDVQTKVILNSEFTSLTDVGSLVDMFKETYQSVYEQNKASIKDSINAATSAATNDKTIAAICSCLMYIRKLYISGCIPQSVLDDTATMIITRDYDEAEMANVLKTLGVFKFSSFCMSLLEDHTQLTEGFMPIPAAKGKINERMQNMITE